MSKEFLWVEKYRPNKVKDCILPDTTRNVFQGFVEQGELPNLLLSGTAGVGKTTIAKAMCEEIGASYIVINGSCLLYTSPSPRDGLLSRMPSSA